MRAENEAFEPQWQEYMFHILCWLLALGDLSRTVELPVSLNFGMFDIRTMSTIQ